MELINAIKNFELPIDIVDAITNCSGKLIFTGIGKNSFVAAKSAATFSSIGVPSFYVDAVHMVHGDFGMISENDIIIALSKSGNTEELVHTVKYLENLKYKSLITIDFSESSEISKYSDYALHLQSTKEMDKWNKVPTNSLLFMQYCIDKIGIAVMEKKNFTLAEFILTHPGGSIGQS